MSQVVDQQDLYRSDLQRVLERHAAGPGWLAERRERAMQRFEALGFPTTREEEWRFTDIRRIARTPFQLAEPEESIAVETAAVRRAALRLGPAHRAVFVDGRFQPELSDLQDLPRSVRLRPLADALRDGEPVLEERLGRYARFEADAFTALNTAFLEDGALLQIDPGAILERPLHLLFLSRGGERARVAHPRNLILAGTDSEATVVEDYVALEDGVYFSNVVTEAAVGPGARLRHYLVERESEEAFNVGTLCVHQERDSHFESHTVLLGGSIVRNNIQVELHGRGADSLVNGLFVPHRSQHMDNHMRVVHAQPDCGSRQFYNGVLDDRARGVFGGRIYVAREAQRTDAKQTNRNLLVSEDAQINTKPQLEIYADDVKCTHGATTGQLDEAALFYLRTRGLSRDAARGMLIYAFSRESLQRMGAEPLREAVEGLLVQRLPQLQPIAELV